jgi:hypothetical protein
MSAPARQLEDRLDRIERMLKELLERSPAARLLSKRQAARLLGIGRSGLLEDLIRAEFVRTVPTPAGPKIPVDEVERLEREGIPDLSSTPTPARKTRQARPRRGRGSIRSIDVDDL